MPNSERGLYEPSDDGRVFDAAEDDEDAEGSRLPLLIVLALLVLSAFGGVVWLAYKQGEARGRGEPRVLVAEAGPAKIAPTEAQSGATPNQGLKIYEQPAPSDEGAEPAVSAMAAKAPEPEAKPVPETTAAKAPPPATPIAPIKPVEAANAPKPAPVKAAPLPPPTKPATLPATVATAAPKPLTPAPVATAPGSGAYMLQIGSFKSQADADAAWRAYQAKHSALLSGYGPDVKSADLGDKGTWYRLRIGSFGDKDVATALCERLKANSGTCILATR